MLTTTEIAGFAGAVLAGAAYVPQISHLIRARCSAGISRLAFEVWLLASLLVTTRAIAIHAGVFIVLGGIQIVATTLIVLYATRYKDTACPIHLPHQPGNKTATGMGTSGKTRSSGTESGSWRPAGRPIAESATPAEQDGAPRVSVPALHPCSYAVTVRPDREADIQVFRSWPRPRMAVAVPCASVARPGRSRPRAEFQATRLEGTA